MKYHVNDYVGGKYFINFKIEAAIDGETPLYALRNPYVHTIQKSAHQYWWITEHLMKALRLEKVKPNFEELQKITAGDILYHSCSHEDDNEYHKVIARAGNLIMLSVAPIKETESPSTKLVSQLNNLADEIGIEEEVKEAITTTISDILPAEGYSTGIDEIDEELGKMVHSLSHSHKVSNNEWTPIEELVYAGHWKLLKEE